MTRHRYRGTGQAGAYSAGQIEMDFADIVIKSGMVKPCPRPSPDFDGTTYERKHDHARLGGQLRLVFDYMRSGEWQTLDEIALAISAPEASISARLRDLRKAKFGGHAVERRPRGERSAGLWEYRLSVNWLSLKHGDMLSIDARAREQPALAAPRNGRRETSVRPPRPSD